MGRSIVFSKNTPKKQVRKTLRRGIQALLAVACVAPMYLDSAAQAQIRTGRQANRDYYPQATSANVPRSSSHQPSSHQPSGHPLRDPRQAEVYASASKSQRSLESISDDPPSQDLPRLSSSDQAESLPKVLANKTTSNQPPGSQPAVSRATVNRPVVTEVAQAKLETQSQVHDRSDSGPPPSSIALASHPAATKQVPVNAEHVIKRVTPARVVSDQTLSLAPSETSTVIDPPYTDDYSEGYVVDDPMGEPNIHSTCGDPACSECGPGIASPRGLKQLLFSRVPRAFHRWFAPQRSASLVRPICLVGRRISIRASKGSVESSVGYSEWLTAIHFSSGSSMQVLNR